MWPKIYALTVLMWATAIAGAAEPNEIARIEQVSSTFRNVVKKVKPAVVFIEVYRESGTVYGPAAYGSGSGVIVDAPRGYVLTAYHVVENVSKVKIKLANGDEYTGTDIRGDEQTDVAVVKIDGKITEQAQLGDSDQMEVGDWVLAIGSPFGAALENSVSAGIVSAKGRRTNVLGRMGIENYIQTDAVINKGNSGGPLVNVRGQVVGINSNIISSTGMYAGLGFAVPSNLVKPVVERLINEGKVVRGWLGVIISSLQEVKEKLPADIIATGGAFVVEVVGQGPGEKGGLKKGDIILSVDDRAVKDTFELINGVSWKRPGEIAMCKLLRGGKVVTIPVILGERPSVSEPTKKTPVETELTEGVKKFGISVADIDIQIARGVCSSRVRAAIILKIEPGSIANKYKLEVGDIITKIDEQAVENAADFQKLIQYADFKKGTKLTVLNSRGEHDIVVKSRR